MASVCVFDAGEKKIINASHRTSAMQVQQMNAQNVISTFKVNIDRKKENESRRR